MPTIVISYRRDDSKWIAGRVFDRLQGHYGKDHVFMDIDSIPFGLDFREHIQQTLDRCDVMVAIVGPNWIGSDQAGGHILDETDWVRIELEAALKKKIPVIPLLIDRSRLPKPNELPDGLKGFAFRQTASVDTEHFHSHMDKVIASIDQHLMRIEQPGVKSPGPSSSPKGSSAQAQEGLHADQRVTEPAATIKSEERSLSDESVKQQLPNDSIGANVSKSSIEKQKVTTVWLKLAGAAGAFFGCIITLQAGTSPTLLWNTKNPDFVVGVLLAFTGAGSLAGYLRRRFNLFLTLGSTFGILFASRAIIASLDQHNPHDIGWAVTNTTATVLGIWIAFGLVEKLHRRK